MAPSVTARMPGRRGIPSVPIECGARSCAGRVRPRETGSRPPRRRREQGSPAICRDPRGGVSNDTQDGGPPGGPDAPGDGGHPGHRTGRPNGARRDCPTRGVGAGEPDRRVEGPALLRAVPELGEQPADAARRDRDDHGGGTASAPVTVGNALIARQYATDDTVGGAGSVRPVRARCSSSFPTPLPAGTLAELPDLHPERRRRSGRPATSSTPTCCSPTGTRRTSTRIAFDSGPLTVPAEADGVHTWRGLLGYACRPVG